MEKENVIFINYDILTNDYIIKVKVGERINTRRIPMSEVSYARHPEWYLENIINKMKDEFERQMEVLETIAEESDIPDSCIECLYAFEDKKKYGKTVCCSKDRRHRDVIHVSRGTRALFCPLKCRKKVK